jgi:hypothetical protein
LVLWYFCCTTLLGVIFMERCFRECYANDLRTTTCSGVLGYRRLKETIPVACWYLRWLRRRRTRNETIPSRIQCKISILTITSNATKAAKPQVLNEVQVWTRPEPRHVKLNVDASFQVDSIAGATVQCCVTTRDGSMQLVASSHLMSRRWRWQKR